MPQAQSIEDVCHFIVRQRYAIGWETLKNKHFAYENISG